MSTYDYRTHQSQMPTNSKSFSLEEYRDSYNPVARKEIHDGYYFDERKDRHRTANKNIDSAFRRFPRSYETRNNVYDIPQLPPPLEPRERLVPCVDPVTADISVIPNWWKCKALGGGDGSRDEGKDFLSSTYQQRESSNNRRIDSYIMPSSLTPVSHASNFTPENFIPPPTAYRDEISSQIKNPSHECFSYSDEDDGVCASKTRSSNCDIIEIKRPGTVCLHRNESDYGLAYRYKPVPHNGYYGVINGSGYSSTCQTNYGQLSEDSVNSRDSTTQSSLCSGIFNLPQVYSPPPLEPISQQISALSAPAGASQLNGLMPSFFENTGAPDQLHNDKQPRFQVTSPRLAYSEPILKSNESDKKLFSHNPSRPITTTKTSPRMRNKTFLIKTSNNDSESIRNCMIGKGLNKPTHCNDQRLRQHEHGQDFYKEKDTFYTDVDENCRRRAKHDGSGDGGNDYSMMTSKQAEFSNHNCLSPRARISRLQPSVITPAITESLLCECIANLKSAHWEENFEAFSQIYNLTEIHPGKVKSILNKVIWHGLPHLSSPRTKLARMACICFKRLYQTQKRSMEIEGEKVFYRLLDLCGGLANNFIQQESREALVAAVEHMDPLKSLTFLELHGAKHKNPHVREFSAYLLNAIMDELPQNKLMNKEFSPRIIPMIVSFLREGLLQTRLHAKLALDKIFDHSTFESKLRRYVSPENVRHIADTLREFRVRAC